jgi:hypothetical protein
MGMIFTALPQSFAQASEPAAILLWGLVLILMSVRLRAGAGRRVQVVDNPQVAAAGRSVIARA